MTDLSIRANRVAALKAAAQERILILDGSWGVMFQKKGLSEADYRAERFAAYIRQEVEKWGQVVTAAGIAPD